MNDIFWLGHTCSQTSILVKMTANHKEHISQVTLLVFFCAWKIQESGVFEILSETCIYLGACLSSTQNVSSCIFILAALSHCSGCVQTLYNWIMSDCLCSFLVYRHLSLAYR